MHFLHQFAGLHLHAVEGEPLLAKVFNAGTEVIDHLIDAEETVVWAIELYDIILNYVPWKLGRNPRKEREKKLRVGWKH